MPTELSPEGLENSKILYEDGEIILLSPLNQFAIREIAPSLLSTGYRYYSDSHIYIILDKEFIDEPYVITENKYGRVEAIDYKGSEVDLSEIIQLFPQAKPELLEILGPQTILQGLELVKLGKIKSDFELKKLDDNIGKLKFNESNPNKSMITIEFQSDSDFFESLNLDEYDVDFLSGLFGGYYNYEFYPRDYEDDDWNDGYMMDYFDSVNRDKVSEIVRLFEPDIMELTGNNFTKNASKLLLGLFSSEVENIKSEYAMSMEECYSQTMKDLVRKELCNIYQNFGIYTSSGCFYRYTTTVNILLNLFKRFGEEGDSIKKMLKNLSEQNFTRIGGYEESRYEYGCGNFDSEGYNRNSGYYLDNMLEEIENNPDKFDKLKKYAELVKKLDEMGYVEGHTHVLPYDKSKSFRIVKIDNKDLKIYINVYTKLGVERRSYSFEEFMNFLQSPELFETIVRKLKKLL